jgi:hypothetical protein
MRNQNPALEEAKKIIAEAKLQVKKVLGGEAGLEMLLMNLNQKFDGMSNSLEVASGGTAVIGDKHPPVTDFMGEKISGANVKKADIAATQTEAQVFRAAVNELYDIIDTVPAQAVYEKFSGSKDELVLRGVAKKAGLVDFQERTFNLQFVEDVIAAVAKAKQPAGDANDNVGAGNVQAGNSNTQAGDANQAGANVKKADKTPSK